MSDLKRYIEKRVKRDRCFAEGFETGYALRVTPKMSAYLP